MKKKVLFSATVDHHIKSFHLPYLKWFQEQGWEVHVAAEGELELPYVDKRYNVCFERSPFKLRNIKAYKELKDIVVANSYNLIHCHTPMGGVLTRLAARAERKKGTKVIYTAHGFHFYKGAPLRNWLMYYSLEKWLTRYTDNLITINQEDYDLALEKRFMSKKISKINGVGVNLLKYTRSSDEEKYYLRSSFNLNSDDFILFFAGELSNRKNQAYLINTVSILIQKIPKIKLLLAGEGANNLVYKNMIKKQNLDTVVDLLGFRKDITKLISLSDVIVSSSKQEGLPVNILEAMACGKPCIVTDVRGNNDLIKDGENGYLCPLNNPDFMAAKIFELFESKELANNMGNNSMEIIKYYSENEIINEMSKLYKEYF